MDLGFPFELQSQRLCGPLPPQCQIWVPLPVGAQKFLLNEFLGTLPSSPQPEPFFRVAVKNEERGQQGTSCLSKVYVTLPETTITLLSGRRTLVSPAFVRLCWGHLRAAAALSWPVLAASRPSQGRAPGHSSEDVLREDIQVGGECGSILGVFLTLGSVSLSLFSASLSRSRVIKSPSQPYLLKASSWLQVGDLWSCRLRLVCG